MKLTKSYEDLKNWITQSGIFISDINNANCGGVHSFYDEKEKKYGFLYPEITGYFTSTMRFLHAQKADEVFCRYAKHSSDWLIKIYDEYGNIIQGINNNSDNLSYSFDSAICAKGLLDCYEMTQEKKYLDYATKILSDLKAEALNPDGSMKPFKHLSNTYDQSDTVWYKQQGCFHIKTSMAFFHMYEISKDETFLDTASKICDTIPHYQNSDGSIRIHKNSDTINLHTLSYALEGLLYGFYVTNNEDYLKKSKDAIDWCIKAINDDGSISLWFNIRYQNKAAYPAAQLIRLIILADKLTNHKEKIQKLYDFLLSFQASNSDSHIHGGFYEELYKSIFGWKKRTRLNSWTSMFALQGIYWYENYKDISLNDIKYLY